MKLKEKLSHILSAVSKKVALPKKAMITICVLLAVILLALIILSVGVMNMLDRVGRLDGNDVTLSPEQMESIMNATEQNQEEITGPLLDPEDVTLSTQATEIEVGDDIINILLVGQDRRPGQPRLHSDSMVLCTINKSHKTVTLTSFLRDLWVDIPGYYHERLNVPYMLKGFDLLNDTLESTFGVRADYNVEVDFAGFQAVIDAVGGIDLELTAAEAKYLNKRGNWDFNNASAGTWNLSSGMNHMTGEQAFAYSRIRALDSDFGRTNRQRYVLTRLMEEIQNISLTKVYSLIQSTLPLLSTDMEKSEMLGLAAEVIPLLSDMEIISQRIPADDACSSVNLNDNGIIKAVLVMDDEDLEKNIELLKDALGKS